MSTTDRNQLLYAQHLAEAIERHRKVCERNGRTVPAELITLGQMARGFRVNLRQPATEVGGTQLAPDAAVVSSPLLTKAEAGEYLNGISVRTVERLAREGHFEIMHIGQKARIRVADLEAYIAGRGAAPRGAA